MSNPTATALPAHRGSVRADLVAQTAAVLLFLRLCEGAAAWILWVTAGSGLVESGQTQGVQGLGIWLLYLLVNWVVFRRYRAGAVSPAAVIWDVSVNLGTILLVAALTGGLRSPAILLCFVKVATYGLVYGAPVGLAGVGLMLSALVAFLGLGGMLDRPSVPSSIETEIAYLFVFGASLGSAGWLFQQIAKFERRNRQQADQARRAAQRAQAAAEVTRALLSVSEAVSRVTNVDEVLAKVVEVTPPVLSVDSCGVFLWREEEDEYLGAAIHGVGPEEREAFLRLRFKAEQVPDLEWVKRLGQCVVLGPIASQQLSGGMSPTVLVAPLLSGGRFYGVVQFTRRDARPFTQEELRVADGIAAQAAVALERARLVGQSYRLLRAIQSTDEAVLIVDARPRVVFANRAFHELFGYSWQELQACDPATLGDAPREGWAAVYDALRREQSWSGELLARTKEGTTIPVSLHASPIVSPSGEIEGAVAILEDIRAERELQERLARADRIAAAGQLAAGLAHEVNNALAVILGQAEVAGGALELATAQAAAKQIHKQGQRIARLIEQLLGFARPRAPKTEAVDLAPLIDATVHLLGPEFARAGIRVERQGDASGLFVQGDAEQIQQVLLNLLKNASEAVRGRGDPRVVVRCARREESVTIEVEDNGCGIPPAVAARVFDPFFTTKPHGTGLGLSVSYAIAQAHGGDLRVHSIPGQGTIFTLHLPAARRAAAEPEYRQRRVLVVDDEDLVAETFRRMLEREGVLVSRAASGSEALAKAKEADFDAILLDVRLPDLSGPEVYRKLAALRPELARRVAFVTGGLWRGAPTSEPLPPQPTLAKPCTSAQLRAVLERLRSLRAAA
mgnify:CR=1 FL=1